MTINKYLLCLAAVIATSASTFAYQPLDSAKAISNLEPTIKKLRDIAMNTAISPEAAKSVLLPGAERFEGLSTTYQLLGGKRMATYTWYTIIVTTQKRWEQQTTMLQAVHKEINRAFPGTYRAYPNAEWTIDSCLKVKTRFKNDGTEMVALLISFSREARGAPQHVADSIRRVFYDRLAKAGSSADQQAVAMRIFYNDLRGAGLSKEIIEAAYSTAAKEKAAANTQIAYVMLTTYPQFIPAARIWNSITPATADAVEQQMKSADKKAADASAAWNANREAATRKAAAAAAPAQPKVPTFTADGLGGPQSASGTYTISRLVTFRSRPSNNYVVTDRGVRIVGVQIDSRNLKKGDQVLVGAAIKSVTQVFSNYAYLNDNTNLNFGSFVTAWRSVWLRSVTKWVNCSVCNNNPVTTGTAPVNVVSGYKTHTYNTGPRTVNVISTPERTQVGSVGTTTYCSGCGGKGGKSVHQLVIEAMD